jgi:hypothetical protein
MTKEERNEEMINSQRMIIQNERDFNQQLQKLNNELIEFNFSLLDDFKKTRDKQWKERKEMGVRLLLAEMDESFTKSFERFVEKQEQKEVTELTKEK